MEILFIIFRNYILIVTYDTLNCFWLEELHIALISNNSGNLLKKALLDQRLYYIVLLVKHVF